MYTGCCRCILQILWILLSSSKEGWLFFSPLNLQDSNSKLCLLHRRQQLKLLPFFFLSFPTVFIENLESSPVYTQFRCQPRIYKVGGSHLCRFLVSAGILFVSLKPIHLPTTHPQLHFPAFLTLSA